MILEVPQFLHDVGFTFSEVLNLLAILGAVVGVWISVRVKLTKLEATTAITLEAYRTESHLKLTALKEEVDLKLKTIESRNAGLVEFLSTRLIEFVNNNKDDHQSIKTDVTHVVDTVNEINIKLARIAK